MSSFKTFNWYITWCRPTIRFSFIYIIYVSYVLIYICIYNFFVFSFYENDREQRQSRIGLFSDNTAPLWTENETQQQSE